MDNLYDLAFTDGGAVEFAKKMKAMREEVGFITHLVQVEGRFPKGEPETLILYIQVQDFTGTDEELRQKISSYVPIEKKKKAEKVVVTIGDTSFDGDGKELSKKSKKEN